MEKNYKADPINRTLMGCSLGGLITLYALLTHTDMFTGYAAASPAVGWDREVLYKYEKEFAEKKLSKPVKVYMTIGDVERSRPGYERIAAQIIAGIILKYLLAPKYWKTQDTQAPRVKHLQEAFNTFLKNQSSS